MAKVKILSQKEFDIVNNMVSEAFQEDSQQMLNIELDKFKAQVDKTILICEQKMRAIYHEGKIKKIVGFKSKTNTASNRILLASAYELIFKFRRFLLNETIDYRYYYRDSEGNIKAISVNENNILKYIKFGKIALQLNPTLLKQNNDAINTKYSELMTKYFNEYVPAKNEKNDYFTSLGKYGYIVRKSIMQEYGNRNSGLKQKKNPRQYQFFNQGHIFEALDIAISHQIELGKQINDQQIKNDVFGAALAYDNIIASQGGDNPFTNTSIKANQADLYDYNTIYQQLKIIKEIISGGLINKNEYQEKISKLFLNKKKFETEEAMEEVAEKAVDKLLNTLKLSNKNLTIN